MAEKYTENHTVACYEADANQLLKPTAMLDWMQEIAGRDATRLGFGYDHLKENQTAGCFHGLMCAFINTRNGVIR